MSIDLLADYAYRFGLGKKTTVPFPEKLGIVPSTTWKRNALGERWWQGETLSATIGQSFLLVTPMQIARMIAAIGQGYLVKPRILETEPIEQEPLNIRLETLQFLKDSMEKVVQQGTGRRLNTMKDIEIYAKTSTAQTTALSKRKLGKEYLEHGWFVANFRYQDNPPLTMVVLVEHAGNAQVPALVAKNFLMTYIKMMNKAGKNARAA